jgi:hypothetical protein
MKKSNQFMYYDHIKMSTINKIKFSIVSIFFLLFCNFCYSQSRDEILKEFFSYRPIGAQYNLYDVVNYSFAFETQINNIVFKGWNVNNISDGVYLIYLSFVRNNSEQRISFTYNRYSRLVEGADKLACDCLKMQMPKVSTYSLGIKLTDFIDRWNSMLSESYPENFSILRIDGKNLAHGIETTDRGLQVFMYRFDNNLVIGGQMYCDHAIREIILMGDPQIFETKTFFEVYRIFIKSISPSLTKNRVNDIMDKISKILNGKSFKQKKCIIDNIDYSVTFDYESLDMSKCIVLSISNMLNGKK